jgi:hypothetical protein
VEQDSHADGLARGLEQLADLGRMPSVRVNRHVRRA